MIVVRDTNPHIMPKPGLCQRTFRVPDLPGSGLPRQGLFGEEPWALSGQSRPADDRRDGSGGL